MHIYMQRATAPYSVNREQLVECRESLRLQVHEITDQLYKVWLVLWSVIGEETPWIQRLYIDGRTSESRFDVCAPVYLSFHNVTGTTYIDLLAFDEDISRGIIELLRKTWRVKPLVYLPLEKIPGDMDVEGVVKRGPRRAQVVEDYDDPAPMELIRKELSSPNDLMAVTLWCDRELDNIRLHAVTLEKGGGAVDLQIELLVPEAKLFENEKGFLVTALGLLPLFYSSNPADLRKACIG